MLVRAFEERDIERVKEIFAQQEFEYLEPDWERMIGGVIEDDTGVVRIALLNRPTVESYALVDRTAWATPGMKAKEFERLDRAVIKDLKGRGYTDQHAWVPPVCRAFLRRLYRYFGWVKSSGDENWTGVVRHI